MDSVELKRFQIQISNIEWDILCSTKYITDLLLGLLTTAVSWFSLSSAGGNPAQWSWNSYISN